MDNSCKKYHSNEHDGLPWEGGHDGDLWGKVLPDQLASALIAAAAA